jgi:hypothetical protein
MVIANRNEKHGGNQRETFPKLPTCVFGIEKIEKYIE